MSNNYIGTVRDIILISVKTAGKYVQNEKKENHSEKPEIIVLYV